VYWDFVPGIECAMNVVAQVMVSICISKYMCTTWMYQHRWRCH